MFVRRNLNTKIRHTFFLLITVLLAGICWGQVRPLEDVKAEPRQQALKLEKNVPVELDYLLYLPEGYGNQNKKWPLMLFLHGAGERGSDLQKVKKHGPPKLVEQGKELPFIVVSPLCPARKFWSLNVDQLIVLLDEIEAKYEVDPERVYLTGLSMGGYGTWALACMYPERFAAVAPICGGGIPNLAGMLKDVPVWAFHGGKDRVVLMERSQEMVDGVKSVGGQARLTIYPEAGHDSYTKTYNNPELYKWFLSHKKIRPQIPQTTKR